MPGRTGVKERAPLDVPAPMIVSHPRLVVKPLDWHPLGISDSSHSTNASELPKAKSESLISNGLDNNH